MMSKKGKKDVVYVCFECDFCRAKLLRLVPDESLKEMEMKRLREQHIELHRLAEIGYKVREIKELANE